MGVAVEFERPSHVVTLVGAGLIVVSAFTPWVAARNAVTDFSVTPASTSLLQPSVWLLLVALVSGVSVFVVKASPVVLGLVAAMWLTFSTLTWLLAVRLSWLTWLLPDRILPEDAAVRLGAGASLGLIGAILASAGTVGVLAEQTWALQGFSMPHWVTPAALVLSGAIAGAREIGWVEVEASGSRWKLDFDAVPFFGDLLSVALLASLAMLAMTVLRPRRWVAWVLAATAGMLLILAAFAAMSGSFAQGVVSDLVERVNLPAQDGAKVATTAGPLVWCALAVLLAGFAFASGRSVERPDRGQQLNRSPVSNAVATPIPEISSTGRLRRPGIGDDGLPV